MHWTCITCQSRCVHASVELAAPDSAHPADSGERDSQHHCSPHRELSDAQGQWLPERSYPNLSCLRRMDGLTSLSISLHAAARHVRESMGGHPRWLGDLPSGLCNLPKLTKLDLSFRAFGQAELCLPQVCAAAGSPACLHAWVLLIAG